MKTNLGDWHASFTYNAFFLSSVLFKPQCSRVCRLSVYRATEMDIPLYIYFYDRANSNKYDCRTQPGLRGYLSYVATYGRSRERLLNTWLTVF